MPVLGLIFLRHAYNRFLVVKVELEKNLPKRAGVTRQLNRDDFAKKSALFLREKSQFEYLLHLSGDKDKGRAIIEAMDAIEQDYPNLAGVLPKEYHIFDSALLGRLLKIFNDETLQSAKGDVFGRIYEYFLMKFAMAGAQDMGEFFTPVSLVQTIVNVIEPDHGIVCDIACGSGGMFVQTSHFIEQQGKDTHKVVTFYGQEKTATTIRLAKMNLAVHGLEGKIVEGNTFYEDLLELVGKVDSMMANPPFNVDGIDAEKIKSDPRLPFGLPGVNNKGSVSNGNYLWISYFYSYLNKKGRAGFVMSSQASSAGHGEKEVRRKLVQTGHVDAMISIRSNFFYTRTVPCELWFLDKGKPEAMRDKVLMLDARNIFRKVTRKVYDFSPEQLKNITSIVWLYRGQKQRFLDLVESYREECRVRRRKLDATLPEAQAAMESFDTAMCGFVVGVVKGESTGSLLKAATEFHGEVAAFAMSVENIRQVILLRDYTADATSLPEFAADCRALHIKLKELMKLMGQLLEVAQPHASKEQRRTLQVSRDAAHALLDECHTAAMENIYWTRQVEWLLHRFPDAEYRDVAGLVKLVDRKDIEAADWSLTPGRYVGVAAMVEDEDFDFEDTMRGIHVELADLNKEAVELADKIQENLEELVG